MHLCALRTLRLVLCNLPKLALLRLAEALCRRSSGSVWIVLRCWLLCLGLQDDSVGVMTIPTKSDWGLAACMALLSLQLKENSLSRYF